MFLLLMFRMTKLEKS